MKDTSLKALKRDFTKGPIFSRLFLLAIPLMASYSISWTLASIAYIVLLLFALPKLRKLKKMNIFTCKLTAKVNKNMV